jgi:hypothetical protein
MLFGPSLPSKSVTLKLWRRLAPAWALCEQANKARGVLAQVLSKKGD